MLPLHSSTNQGCSCGHAGCGGKHPRTRHGLHDATLDAQIIKGWWTRWPNAGVGIRTGSASGLVVIDVDPGHGGQTSFNALLKDHGGLRQVPLRVRTGGDGWHLYFAHPGTAVPNDAGRRLGPGLDVRGDGGYVVAPPSIHQSTKPYRWVGAANTPPPLPPWLAQRLVPPPLVPRRNLSLDMAPSIASRYADAALTGELAALAGAPEHTRNDTLNRAAFNIGQLAIAGDPYEATVRDALLAQAQAIGLSEREALATIESGLRAGQDRPRSVANLSQRPDERLRTSIRRPGLSQRPRTVTQEIPR